MAYPIRTYSLNELSRISVPGTITPAMFWAVPIGKWPAGLHELKRWFTKHPTLCNEHGVLLYRSEDRPSGATNFNADLGSVEAQVLELMPSGIVRFFRRHPQPYSHPAFRPDENKLLVLSAGYPQPGWGVLLNFPGEDRFEQLVSRAMAQLVASSHHAALAAFGEARRLFRIRREAQDERPRDRSEDLAGFNKNIQLLESAFQSVQHGLDALRMKAFSLAAEHIGVAISHFSSPDWTDGKVPCHQLSRQQKLLDAACSLAAIDDPNVIPLLESTIQELDAQHRPKGEVFRAITDNSAKRALAACLQLREEAIAGTVKECFAWARTDLPNLHKSLCDALHSLAEDLRDALVTQRGMKSQLETERETEQRSWTKRRRIVEKEFRVALEKATLALLEIGPAFLVALEKECRDGGLWVRSIPWDPARMVGWKLKAYDVSLRSIDLWTAAKGIVKDPPPPPSDGEVDGSYFTDYVHFAAISCPQMTPFSVTQQMVAKLLLPSQLVRILKTYQATVDETLYPIALAGHLLRCFGWNESDPGRETPLEYCIDRTVEGHSRLRAELTVHDLRTVVESFCKDLVDVAVQVLGYDTDRIWEAIHYENPLYQPRSRDKDWDDEVRHLTIGSAEIVLKSLLPLAWPADPNTTTSFFETLATLRPLLNAKSHHKSDLNDVSKDSRVPDDGAAALVDRLLRDTKTLVGEMPWHMTATVVYGEQPKVLSGEAWSHSSATPRLIRVIDWNRRAPGRKVTLWNKTGRNPVIADPEFIRRPLSPGD